MRRLLPAPGIEPFRLTSARHTATAGVYGEPPPPRSSISSGGEYRPCRYPASRVSGPGWRCNSLSRATPQRGAARRAAPLPVRLTNSLIIFADAADTLREKNVLRPTVNSRRPRYLRSPRRTRRAIALNARVATRSHGDARRIFLFAE